MNTEEKLVYGLKLVVEAFAEMIKDNKSEVEPKTFNIVNTGLPRMRTIVSLVKEIKAIDPTTTVTEHHVRQLVKTNKIKYHVAGTKTLINLDMFLEYLENPPKAESEENISYGTIRKIGDTNISRKRR